MLHIGDVRESWFSHIDSRVKLLMFAVYILAVLLTSPDAYRTWLAFAILLTCMLILGRVSWRMLFMRLAVLLPFIGLCALGVLIGGSQKIFWQVVAKSSLCVIAATWLALTTPFHTLLHALKSLRAPTLIVVLLSFMYRYLFVLADEAHSMHRAYISRCPRKQDLRDATRIGKLMAALMLRAYERAERVYVAMLSRGFDGEFRLLSTAHPRWWEWMILLTFTSIVISIFVLVR